MDDAQRPGPEGMQFSTAYPGGTARPPEWDAPAAKTPTREPRLAPAILAGIVAAAAAAAVWYLIVGFSGYQIGFLAVGIGFVIAFVMRRAAGGVGGIRLQISAVVLTLVSMFAAEFFIARKFLGEYFVSQGNNEPLRLLLAPADMFDVVADVLKQDPLTLLFWAIALYTAWRGTRATHEQVAAPPPSSAPPAAAPPV